MEEVKEAKIEKDVKINETINGIENLAQIREILLMGLPEEGVIKILEKAVSLSTSVPPAKGIIIERCIIDGRHTADEKKLTLNVKVLGNKRRPEIAQSPDSEKVYVFLNGNIYSV